MAAGKFDGEEGISPLADVGGVSLIRRLVLTLQQANINLIVVITGCESLELRHHLADYEVVFICNENYETSDKFASAKMGLRFLQNLCDKVALVSLKTPFFKSETLRSMCQEEGNAVIPVCQGRRGHPLLIRQEIIPDILAYSGNDGMRGAIGKIREKTFLDVSDEGVLNIVENGETFDDLIKTHNRQLMHPFVRLSLETGQVFFDKRAKMLLCLIREVHSVQKACEQVGLSRGKAWDLIARMEREMGFTIVQRQQGGGRERKTRLTPEGEYFLASYIEYEGAVRQYAREKFQEWHAKLKEELS